MYTSHGRHISEEASQVQSTEETSRMETTTYVRKQFEVEAVQVTEENIEDVREWCQGTLMEDHRRYIKVRVTRPLNERQTKAYPGDWVLYAGTGFKVYTHRAFNKTFELPTSGVHANVVPSENDNHVLDGGLVAETPQNETEEAAT